MQVAIYGGSFHPPHVGHGLVASWLHWAERADEVWLVPVYQHAFGKDLAPFEARVAWCQALAEAVGPWVKVSEIESTSPDTSYTIHTLEALAAAHPEHRFRLVVGADVLPDTPRWKSWDRIAAGFDPIVVGRAGHGDIEGAPTFPEVSSTEIRQALQAGTPIDHLVPAKVLRAMARTGHGPGSW